MMSFMTFCIDKVPNNFKKNWTCPVFIILDFYPSRMINAVMKCYHDHGPNQDRGMRELTWSFFVTLAYFVIEVVGGFLTGSLALLADAGHMLTDVAAIALALFAVLMAHRPATPKKTFGYHRVEILVALFNGIFLWVLVGFIFYHAYYRFFDPPPVKSLPMFIVALGGLAANGLNVFLLARSRHKSLNVKGAFLHAFSDALGSIGACVAGLIMILTEMYFVDALASFLIGFLILYSSWGLIRDSIHILMEGTPFHIDLEEICKALRGIEGVRDCHDIHVWTLTSGMESLSGHLIIEGSHSRQAILEEAHDILERQFNIHHMTLQLEEEDLKKEGADSGP